MITTERKAMHSDAYRGWIRAFTDAWLLAAESATVVGLRSARLAAGGDTGTREATLMISEKVAAAFELQAALIGAGPDLTILAGTQKALRHYRGKVAANRRRLTR